MRLFERALAASVALPWGRATAISLMYPEIMSTAPLKERKHFLEIVK
jgi:hypothetical protein